VLKICWYHNKTGKAMYSIAAKRLSAGNFLELSTEAVDNLLAPGRRKPIFPVLKSKEQKFTKFLTSCFCYFKNLISEDIDNFV
jgi:hypothetical protein